MKNLPLSKTGSGFSGTQRYYHRSGSSERSWDEWVGDVDPKKAKSRNGKNRLKITGVVVAALALGGILAGLFIELA